MVQLSLSEIRTTHQSPECPKSERYRTEQAFVRISALFGFRTFGFQTLTVYVLHIQKSDVSKIWMVCNPDYDDMSKIQTSPDFRPLL